MSITATDTADTDALKARYPNIFRRNARLVAQRLAFAGIALGLVIYGCVRLELSLSRVVDGLVALGRFIILMFPPTAGSWEKLAVYMHALGETLAIAFLGTIIAAILALPFSFLAARNVMPLALVRILARRSSDTIRGIDQLIWALIWVGVVGLGPMAGVLAVATSDLATFVKLFSETIETSDKRPVEGITSVGGARLHAIRFAIVPQVLPVIAGQILYLFESNTRSSTIIGIVGAGGIGLHISEQIRVLEWQQVSLLVIIILTTVAMIDFVSSRLRHAIIDSPSGRASGQ